MATKQKWWKTSLEDMLKKFSGEPWHDMPFEVNVQAWVETFEEKPKLRDIVCKEDMDSLAQYLFERDFFDTKKDWMDVYGLDEFNTRLKGRLAQSNINIHLHYSLNPTPIGGELKDAKWMVDYKDLTLISDPELHSVKEI